jgi:hypothetical protein
VDGQESVLPLAPRVSGGRVFVPVEAVAKLLGFNVISQLVNYSPGHSVRKVWLSGTRFLEESDAPTKFDNYWVMYTEESEGFHTYVMKDGGRTERGAKIGDGYDDVVGLYGPPHWTTYTGGALREIWYVGPPWPGENDAVLKIGFYFRDGRINWVMIYHFGADVGDLENTSAEVEFPHYDQDAGDMPEPPPLSDRDLTFMYKGVEIGYARPMDEVAGALDFDLDGPGSRLNIELRMKNAKLKDMPGRYTWYVLHYPDVEREDMTLEYLIDELSGEGRLVRAKLFTSDAVTGRGLRPGDTEDDFLAAYGDFADRFFIERLNECWSIYYDAHSGLETSMPDLDTVSVSFMTDAGAKTGEEHIIRCIDIQYGSELAWDFIDSYDSLQAFSWRE